MSEQEMRDFMRERTKDVRAADLTELVQEVMAMEHDYGTVCVAIGYLAAAAARAADREPNGGITGFQASAVFWEFVTAWGVFTPNTPKRMIDYNDLLYPQMLHKLEPRISAETWEWAQKRACELLTETNGDAHPAVKAHWELIASGVVPAGLILTDDR